MTTLLSPLTSRTAELRGWALGLRELRRDAIDLAVRGRTGVAGLHAGERCFATARGPGRWLVGLVDARGPGDEAADIAHDVVLHLRRTASVRGLAAVLTEMNTFVRAADPGRLVSMALLDVDAPRHSVRIAIAGGLPVKVAGRSGDVVAVGDRGPALGLVADPRWHESGPVRLAPGHVLVAATDGVPERARDDGMMFGDARVAEVLRARRAEGPRSVVRAMLDRTEEWSREDPSDRTVLAFRVR